MSRPNLSLDCTGDEPELRVLEVYDVGLDPEDGDKTDEEILAAVRSMAAGEHRVPADDLKLRIVSHTGRDLEVEVSIPTGIVCVPAQPET
jgi:hypothetical protein